MPLGAARATAGAEVEPPCRASARRRGRPRGRSLRTRIGRVTRPEGRFSAPWRPLGRATGREGRENRPRIAQDRRNRVPGGPGCRHGGFRASRPALALFEPPQMPCGKRGEAGGLEQRRNVGARVLSEQLRSERGRRPGRPARLRAFLQGVERAAAPACDGGLRNAEGAAHYRIGGRLRHLEREGMGRCNRREAARRRRLTHPPGLVAAMAPRTSTGARLWRQSCRSRPSCRPSGHPARR